MTRILGHNYIGGQRNAAGTVKLQSVDASTGEALAKKYAKGIEVKPGEIIIPFTN